MNQTAIYWPMIAQVALTVAVYWLMSIRRIAAVKAGEAKARDFRVPVDPERSVTAARNVTNQFELPVLFYVACLAFHQVGAVGLVAIVLAWAFVLSRVAHAYVHVTSNRVMLRRRLFIVGLLVVIAMWVWLAVRIAAA